MTVLPEQRFEVGFDHDHPSFAGHFPGRPLVPGVLLLGEIIARIERATGLQVLRSTQTRFSRAIGPAQVVTVHWRREGATASFTATTSISQRSTPVADGRLVLEMDGV